MNCEFISVLRLRGQEQLGTSFLHLPAQHYPVVPVLTGSVADPDPGSCAFLTRDPEQVFPGSRIPNPYFDSFMTIFFGKKYCNL
jgi:hypothetical protein